MFTASPLLRVAAPVVGITLAVWPTHTRATAQLPLPATLYPPHTRISVLDPLSNAQMDCDWGFDCAQGQPVRTAPVYHLHTEDELHRLSGWAEFGDRRGHRPRMLFALYASRYDPTPVDGLPGNMLAFADFRMVLILDGYQEIEHYPALLPQGVVGNSGVQLVRSPNGDMLAMACWTGAIEVEGTVTYQHGSPSQRHLAMLSLAQQLLAAVKALQAREQSDR